MTPSHDLGRLLSQVSKRSARLRQLCDHLLPPVTGDARRTVAYIAIEAAGLFARFQRAYYLSVMFGARRTSGPFVLPGPPFNRAWTEATAISEAVRLVGRRTGGEPAWINQRTLFDLAQKCAFSNLAEVTIASSYLPPHFRELVVVRNFFAHRSRDTAEKVRQIARDNGLPVVLKPWDVACSCAPKRPQHLMLDWIDHREEVARLLCA